MKYYTDNKEDMSKKTGEYKLGNLYSNTEGFVYVCDVWDWFERVYVKDESDKQNENSFKLIGYRIRKTPVRRHLLEPCSVESFKEYGTMSNFIIDRITLGKTFEGECFSSKNISDKINLKYECKESLDYDIDDKYIEMLLSIKKQMCREARGYINGSRYSPEKFAYLGIMATKTDSFGLNDFDKNGVLCEYLIE